MQMKYEINGKKKTGNKSNVDYAWNGNQDGNHNKKVMKWNESKNGNKLTIKIIIDVIVSIL